MRARSVALMGSRSNMRGNICVHLRHLWMFFAEAAFDGNGASRSIGIALLEQWVLAPQREDDKLGVASVNRTVLRLRGDDG